MKRRERGRANYPTQFYTLADPPFARDLNVRMQKRIPARPVAHLLLLGYSFEGSQGPRVEATRFRKSQKGRRVAPHFSPTIRGIVRPRPPINVVQLALAQDLFDAQKISATIFFVFKWVNMPSHSSNPAIPGPRPAKGPEESFKNDTRSTLSLSA